MKRTWKFATTVVIGVLAVVGCSSESTPEASPTPTWWPQATGVLSVIDPPDTVGDVETIEMDGVSFAVPDGWEPVRSETDRYVQIRIPDPDDSTAGVLVTITKTPGDPDAVEASASAAFGSVSLGGGTDLEQRPASWDAWEYATAITATVNPTGDEPQDYILVVALSSQGLVVGVSAQCVGSLEGSEAFQVLQSLRAVE